MKRSLEPILKRHRFEPLVRYYEDRLIEIDQRLESAGGELVVIHFRPDKPWHPRRWELAQETISNALAEVTARNDIAYLDTKPAFRGCSECFLEQDGHLSEEGHRRLAAFLDEMILD